MKNIFVFITIFFFTNTLTFSQHHADSLIKKRELGAVNVNMRICAPARASMIKQPLFVINYRKKSYQHLNDSTNNNLLNLIPPQSISSINILKGTKAIAQYGKKAENGAIILTLKNKNMNGLKKNLGQLAKLDTN